MMGTCAICNTKITSLRDEWIHLVDGNDDHKPTPARKTKR